MSEFCLSNSAQFDEMVADLGITDFEDSAAAAAAETVTVFPNPSCLVPPTFNYEKLDFNLLYSQISTQELRNAVSTLNCKTSFFDPNWQDFQIQFGAGCEALKSQNVDQTCVFALCNMVKHLRSELEMVKSSALFAMLHLLHSKVKDEQDNQKRLRAAKSKAKARSAKLQVESEVKKTLANLVPIPLEQIKLEQQQQQLLQHQQQQQHILQQQQQPQQQQQQIQIQQTASVAKSNKKRQPKRKAVPVVKIKCPEQPDKKKKKNSPEYVEEADSEDDVIDDDDDFFDSK